MYVLKRYPTTIYAKIFHTLSSKKVEVKQVCYHNIPTNITRMAML